MLATAWGVGNIIWAMFAFFFWVIAIVVFIMVFGDIFRRHDIGGGAKAGWILLLVILPLFGALIYLIARPQVFEAKRGSASGYTPGNEDLGNLTPRMN